jgi:ABC-type phosphate transport system substrate-binding protein
MSVSLLATGAMLGAMGLSLGLAALPAQAAPADYAPSFNDVVGVGSDTLQYILDFGDDGDPSGDTGYNGAGNLYKVVSIDATADSNARAAYLNNSTDASLLPLDPTVVLRAGTFPVQRPNGGGAGISALLADTAVTDPYIDFVRSPSQPTAAQAAAAASDGWGGLQEFVLGTDNLEVAKAATGSNAPAGLSVAQLAQIYECNPTGALGGTAGQTTWNNVGGTSTDNVIPAIPQTGSGIRTLFLADLGITSAQLGSCVVTVEQNDPTGITGNTDPADVIEPFSGSRLNLWNGKSGNTADGANPSSGYFHNPTTPYPGAATAETSGITLLTGAPAGTDSSGGVYDDDYDLYVVYRWSDQTSSTPWQPGGTENWAQTLFCNPGGTTVPFFQTPAGKTLIAEAGADPVDQGCLSSPAT